MPLSALFVLTSKKNALHWLIGFGGPGLILVGIADNSVIPMPGSNDVATVLLAAHHRDMWFYYSLMATVGAILGGYITYHMAQKGCKATLEKRHSEERIREVYAI